MKEKIIIFTSAQNRNLDEDKLKFTFTENCQASKYDEWSFYKNQFQSIGCNKEIIKEFIKSHQNNEHNKQLEKVCGGSKAIDIICISKKILWLIEVKDYRVNRRTKPIDIGDEIAIKVRDTLAGLVAAKNNANNQDEKQFAILVLRNSTSIRIVLHLEQPTKHSKLFPRVINPANIKMKLKKRLKAIDPHPLVIDKNSLKPDMCWTVS